MKSFDEEQARDTQGSHPIQLRSDRGSRDADLRAAGPAAPMGPGKVLAMQRTVGNAAVVQLLEDKNARAGGLSVQREEESESEIEEG